MPHDLVVDLRISRIFMNSVPNQFSIGKRNNRKMLIYH